jgi:hypothetical protein
LIGALGVSPSNNPPPLSGAAGEFVPGLDGRDDDKGENGGLFALGESKTDPPKLNVVGDGL